MIAFAIIYFYFFNIIFKHWHYFLIKKSFLISSLLQFNNFISKLIYFFVLLLNDQIKLAHLLAQILNTIMIFIIFPHKFVVTFCTFKLKIWAFIMLMLLQNSSFHCSTLAQIAMNLNLRTAAHMVILHVHSFYFHFTKQAFDFSSLTFLLMHFLIAFKIFHRAIIALFGCK